MKLRLYIAAILAIVASTTTLAQVGDNAYNFLNIATSTQAYGLGGTNVAVINDDLSLADQNPALVGAEIDKQITLSYMNYLGSANFAAARYGMAAGERGAWTAGIRYLNYGSITSTDQTGQETGNFTPQDIVFDGSYTHDFTDRLRGGIMLKMIYSNYEQYTAFAIATDLGLNYYDPEHDLSLGLVFKNLGGQVKRFDTKYDRLPFDIQIGYMQGLGSSPFSLSVTLWNLTKWNLPVYGHDKDAEDEDLKPHTSFGGNLFRHIIFGLQYQPSDNFYADLAYNYKMRSDMRAYSRNILSGFSLGLGLNVKAFKFGVAYAMPHKGASTIMINIGTNLGELLR